MKTKKTRKKWDWPYCGRGEFLCKHGIGHGLDLHGCDGCCDCDEAREKIKKAYEIRKQRPLLTLIVDQYYFEKMRNHGNRHAD